MYSDDDTNDDIEKIKQAMRVSKARQHAYTQKTSKTTRTMDSEKADSSIFVRKQNDHIVQLETQLMSKEEELKYLKKRLDQKEKTLEESKILLEKKAKAVEDEVRQSFAESHAALMHKYRVLEHSASKLLPLICAIERSTMHGRHMIPSETNMSMIIKLKEGVQQIKDTITETSTLQIVRSCDFDKENTGYGRNECSEHLDTTLLDICRALEKENAELRKALVEGEEKWSKAEDQVSKSSLIPQYRAAIVKARAEASAMEDEVKRLQTWNKHLTSELEAAREDAHSNITENSRLKGLLTQAKDERDKYKATINDMLQHESKDALAREYSLLASQYGVNYPKLSSAGVSFADQNTSLHGGYKGGVSRVSSSLDAGRSEGMRFSNQMISSASYPQSKLVSTASHERAVERDLELLDGEIGDLRRRLEVAAVSKTKNIVSEVMENAAMARDLSERV